MAVTKTASTTTASLSSSSKENRAPNHGVLPKNLTFERFAEYCEDSERRADLWDELQGQRVDREVLDLLEVYHRVNTHKKSASRFFVKETFVRQRLNNLSSELQAHIALYYDPKDPATYEISQVLNGFAGTSKSLEAFMVGNLRSQKDGISECESIQRLAFRILQSFDIDTLGRSAFIRHQYKTIDWTTNGWGKTNEEWVKEGKECKEEEEEKGDTWGEPDAATLERWENVKFSDDYETNKINTTFVDPQA